MYWEVSIVIDEFLFFVVFGILFDEVVVFVVM